MKDTARDAPQTDFPYWPLLGLNDGYSRLALVYRAGSLVMWSKDGDVSDDLIEAMSGLARRIDALGQRSASMSGSFSKAAQKYSEKAVSFSVENAPIFGAAIAGALHSPAATIAGSMAATYPHALGAWFLKRLDEAGYDVKDPAQLKLAVNDREFMRRARASSHFHAAQMSGAVGGAGVLAGVASSVLAKPLAGVGANVASRVLPRLVGERLMAEVAEKGITTMFGDMVVKGFKSGVNSVTRKALGSATVKPYMRSMFLSAALATGAVEAQAVHYDARPDAAVSGFPTYNTSLRYI